MSGGRLCAWTLRIDIGAWFIRDYYTQLSGQTAFPFPTTHDLSLYSIPLLLYYSTSSRLHASSDYNQILCILLPENELICYIIHAGSTAVSSSLLTSPSNLN